MRRRACLSCHKGLPRLGRSPISCPCSELVRHVVALLRVPPVAKPSLLFTLDDLMSSEGQSRVGAARPAAGRRSDTRGRSGEIGRDPRACAWEEPDFSVEADAQRHQSPCSDRRPDGRRKNEMKDRQRCQSEAEARLSSGSAIAVPAITISLKSSLSTTGQHRREEPSAVIRTIKKPLPSVLRTLHPTAMTSLNDGEGQPEDHSC